MLIKEALLWATQALKEKQCETAALDASLILGHLLHFSRTQLIAHDTDPISPAAEDNFVSLINRRASGYPVAYILGYKEFFGLTLKVNKYTLIPRPDTETLVEEALKLKGELRVLDLGTGSGAIILALKANRPLWQCSACDVCAETLQVAKENAKSLGIEVDLRLSNWFDAFSSERFDLIVANPPYIATADEHLNESSLPFEPRSALVSGSQGLDDLSYIISKAPLYLKSGGVLMLEHGYDQAEACRTLLHQAGFGRVYTVRDLGSQERVSVGEL